VCKQNTNRPKYNWRYHKINHLKKCCTIANIKNEIIFAIDCKELLERLQSIVKFVSEAQHSLPIKSHHI